MSEAPAELQGRLHPLALLVILRRFVGASLIPALALIISAGWRVLVPLLLLALFVGVPLALLSWSRFRYRVAAGRLELHSGVVSRSVRTVPVERVRGVDVTAPFLHRLLGLVRVEVEAAAGEGSKAEFSLAAVSRGEAEALRGALLGAPAAERVDVAEERLLYRATPARLAVAGFTSLRYLLAPAAVVGVVANIVDDLPGGLLERAGEAALDRAPHDVLGITVVAVAAAAIAVVLAAAGSLLVDWDFTLRDDGERLTATRGLLTRRAVLIDRDRIRGVDVRDTPLRRPLRLVSVTAIAGGLRNRTGGTTLAPVLHAAESASLLRAIDPLAPDPAAPLLPHPPAARRRRLVRALPLPVLLLVVAIVVWVPWAIAAAAILSTLAVPLALDRYRQLGHALLDGRLALRGGTLLRRWSEVDPDAVVAFALESSPFQRRAGVCTLFVHLGQGAGSRHALDLGEDQARALLAGLHPRLLEPLLARSPEAP